MMVFLGFSISDYKIHDDRILEGWYGATACISFCQCDCVVRSGFVTNNSTDIVFEIIWMERMG